ncbi:hypothetical protein SASPL_105897 [Salvia splendens]|uniref:Uncharacterized protein n=1 Tax=Salvia splendens TaxID=180675 RepID=A0A8X8YK11_SALSN|nr:hypothetical protein SASPL_105897 [Salvia splendens]
MRLEAQKQYCATSSLVIGYALCSSLLSLINKLAITKFNYPGLLTALQYLTSAAGVWILEIFGKDRAEGVRSVDTRDAVHKIYGSKADLNEDSEMSSPPTLEELFPDEVFHADVLPEMVDESTSVPVAPTPKETASEAIAAVAFIGILLLVVRDDSRNALDSQHHLEILRFCFCFCFCFCFFKSEFTEEQKELATAAGEEEEVGWIAAFGEGSAPSAVR